MRRVHLEVTSASANPVDAEIRIERRKDRTSPFTIDQSIAVTSGTADAVRDLLLGDNDRIVIEPRGTVEIVFDKEQGAATTKEALDSNELATPEAKQEQEKRHAAEREAAAKGLPPELVAQEKILKAQDDERKANQLRAVREAEIAKTKKEAEVERRTVAPGIAQKPESSGLSSS